MLKIRYDEELDYIKNAISEWGRGGSDIKEIYEIAEQILAQLLGLDN